MRLMLHGFLRVAVCFALTFAVGQMTNILLPSVAEAQKFWMGLTIGERDVPYLRDPDPQGLLVGNLSSNIRLRLEPKRTKKVYFKVLDSPSNPAEARGYYIHQDESINKPV